MTPLASLPDLSQLSHDQKDAPIVALWAQAEAVAALTARVFEAFSQRYERGATIVTSNLPFDEWTSVFGSERLTGALLDRLTHHVHILEMNGDSYRLAHSKARRRKTNHVEATTATDIVDPHTGEIVTP